MVSKSKPDSDLAEDKEPRARLALKPSKSRLGLLKDKNSSSKSRKVNGAFENIGAFLHLYLGYSFFRVMVVGFVCYCF